jgi:hypothetical protein
VKLLLLGVAATLLLAGPARASDTFRVQVGGDQNWGPTSGGLDETAPTQLDKAGTMTGTGGAVGTVDYHVQAGPGIARAAMRGDVTVPSNLAYPFNPSVQAVSTTELTINGPGFELNTSLNLHVDGYIERPVCGGVGDCGALSVFIYAPTGTTAGATAELNSNGDARSNDLGLAFDPVPGGYHVHGDVRSRPFGVRVNTPIPIGIVLNLSGRFAGRAERSTFGGGFDDPVQRLQVSFAPSGPVLNDIPAADTVTGSGVVDNRWSDPFTGDVVATGCTDPALTQATTIRGSLILRSLAGCGLIAPGQLTHIGGDLVIEGNRSPHVSFPGPVLIDGSVRVVGNDGDVVVDIGGGSVGGDLDIVDNPDAGVIDVSDGQIGGDLEITDNGDAVVNAGDAVTVEGDLVIEAGGNVVNASTAGQTTDVAIAGGTAAMHVVLPDAAFDRPVPFSITRRGDDPPEGLVDPLAGYTFAFAVPTLNAPARLAFTLDLAGLDERTRTAVLAGAATIATKGDDPGAAYQTFPRCAGEPAEGCVTVTPLPDATAPTQVRFDGVVGHFSTYAVALVSAPPPVLSAPPAPPVVVPVPGVDAARIRALLLSQITPRGKAGRIGALLKRGYRLPFRAPTPGTARVEWSLRNHGKRIVVAAGRRAFSAAGTGTIALKLTVAGRRQLRHARRLRLTATGTLAGVTASRTFTLRR